MLKKIKKNVYFIYFLISLSIILYVCDGSLTFVKKFLVFLLNKKIAYDIKDLFLIVSPFICVLWCLLTAFFLFYPLVNCFIIKRKRKQFKNIESKNDLNKELNNYILTEDKSCFYVYGEWGSGKSYSVMKFTDELKHCNYCNVYHISCFGISSREALVEQIKQQCENQDKSIRKKILEFVKCIPFIGEALFNLLKKNYSITNIDKNSLFVFDDFERISICDSNSDKKKLNIKTTDSKIIMKDYLYYINKYNIVTGFINDIVENYNMRAIIIANDDFIPSEIQQNVIFTKLACKRYKLVIDNRLIDYQELFQKYINSFAFKVEQVEQIENFFKTINVEKLLKNCQVNNLRLIKEVSYYFLNIVYSYNIINDNDIYFNVFFSILLAKISIRNNCSDILLDIEEGENVFVFIHKIKKIAFVKINETFFSIINNVDEFNTLKWCGSNISFSFLTGSFGVNKIKEIIFKIDSNMNEFEVNYALSNQNSEPNTFTDLLLLFYDSKDPFLFYRKPISQLQFDISKYMKYNSYGNEIDFISRFFEYNKLMQFFRDNDMAKDSLFAYLYRVTMHSISNNGEQEFNKLYTAWIKEKNNKIATLE